MTRNCTAEIKEIRDEVAALKSEMEAQNEHHARDAVAEIEKLRAEALALRAEIGLQKEFASLRNQVTLDLSHMKWAAAAAGLLLSAFGFMGWKTWHDVSETIQHRADKAIDEVSSRTYELARGFALADTFRSSEAIPYLEAAYERNHYDEPVVSAYMSALENVGEWDRAAAVIDQLRSDSSQFSKFRSGVLFNNIGSLLVSKSLSEPARFPSALAMLQLSIDRFEPDDIDRKYPLWNLARYWVEKGDFTKAKDYLSKSGWVKSASLDDVKNYVWYTRLPEDSKKEFIKIWSAVDDEFKKKT